MVGEGVEDGATTVALGVGELCIGGGGVLVDERVAVRVGCAWLVQPNRVTMTHAEANRSIR